MTPKWRGLRKAHRRSATTGTAALNAAMRSRSASPTGEPGSARSDAAAARVKACTRNDSASVSTSANSRPAQSSDAPNQSRTVRHSVRFASTSAFSSPSSSKATTGRRSVSWYRMYVRPRSSSASTSATSVSRNGSTSSGRDAGRCSMRSLLRRRASAMAAFRRGTATSSSRPNRVVLASCRSSTAAICSRMYRPASTTDSSMERVSSATGMPRVSISLRRSFSQSSRSTRSASRAWMSISARMSVTYSSTLRGSLRSCALHASTSVSSAVALSSATAGSRPATASYTRCGLGCTCRRSRALSTRSSWLTSRISGMPSHSCTCLCSSSSAACRSTTGWLPSRSLDRRAMKSAFMSATARYFWKLVA